MVLQCIVLYGKVKFGSKIRHFLQVFRNLSPLLSLPKGEIRFPIAIRIKKLRRHPEVLGLLRTHASRGLGIYAADQGIAGQYGDATFAAGIRKWPNRRLQFINDSSHLRLGGIQRLLQIGGIHAPQDLSLAGQRKHHPRGNRMFLSIHPSVLRKVAARHQGSCPLVLADFPQSRWGDIRHDGAFSSLAVPRNQNYTGFAGIKILLVDRIAQLLHNLLHQVAFPIRTYYSHIRTQSTQLRWLHKQLTAPWVLAQGLEHGTTLQERVTVEEHIFCRNIGLRPLTRNLHLPCHFLQIPGSSGIRQGKSKIRPSGIGDLLPIRSISPMA